MPSTEEDHDHIIKGLFFEISETLPLQELKANLSERLPDILSGETHISFQTCEETSPSTNVLPKEMSFLPIQVSQCDSLVRFRPPDLWNLKH